MVRILLALLVVVAAVPPAAQADTRLPQSRAEISLSFAPLVKRAAPAVVNIYVRRVTEGRASPFRGDPFFEEFFRGFGAPAPRVENSLGSGVILSPDGIVVSNYHVVGQATDIRVVLTDRREFNARVLLGDPEADLAILKLEGAEGLPALELRDSDQVEVGELVLAIGNPFGVGQTVSSGIVSGLARSGTATGNARGYFIQTDAPINPGNSGGALIDMAGRVIGINTSILTRSGGSNGIGFAIPSNLVRQFVTQAQAGAERFQRPWAGMAGDPVTADIAEALALPSPEGLVIAALHEKSSFRVAGLQAGDVITAVDGLPVNSPSEMLFRMTVAGIGATARITWVRGGEMRESEVAMIAAPEDPPTEARELGRRAVLPGLVVGRINPAQIVRFGLPLEAEGVVVLDAGPIAPRVGLQAGDVILAINGAAVRAPGDVEAYLARPGNAVRIDILRQGQRVALRFRV